MKPHGKKLKVGVAGVGGFGRTTVEAISQSRNLALVAGCDVKPEAVEEFGRQWRCYATNDYAEMLQVEGLEAVCIITPNHLHRTQAIEAAKAGKHVYVAKPLTSTVAEARDIVDACEQVGVRLAVGYMMRFSTPIRKMKEMLDQELLGQVVMCETNISHSLGLHLTPSDWRWQKVLCPTGPLEQLGVHAIDSLCFLLGPVEAVQCIFDRRATPAEIPDVILALLRLRGGIPTYLGTSYSNPWNGFLRICGTRGNLTYDLGESLVVRWEKGGQEETIPVDAGDGQVQVLEEFANAVIEGRDPETSGKRALHVQYVIDACCRAANSGRVEAVLQTEEAW